ncbi:ankyrin repeat-containing protein At5g02620-like isoform X2 [Phragmites australis]|uniref:ankyrin repeat-containing protein At5g02620-like isoform X2 n=1 Tax=Phragmites australis TaxID=29695 RepID=UPI002D7A4090|nr:ankyrin repeat-containing protein At5g02620-like isoform X2 [Phragmites australis]
MVGRRRMPTARPLGRESERTYGICNLRDSQRQKMSVELTERMEEAWRKAEQLKDENLQAALRRARESPDDTRFLLPLMQLPQEDENGHGAAGRRMAERKVMCPELYRAAFSGSAQKVRDLLATSEATGRMHEGRCSLDEVSAAWNTVLHVAAGEGHAFLVRQLFQDAAAAALLPSENLRSETALHRAARAGHRGVVSLLILLAQAPEGPGALQILVRTNSGGDTALHVAARHGRQAVVEVLMVAAPALSCAVNDAGMSPLYLAVMSRSVGAVKALINWGHASASGPKMQNALHAAVLQSADITSEILSWKPDLAKQGDESGSTPLHYAASDGDRNTISSLTKMAPLAAYEQDNEGFTPLHVAAWVGHVEVIHKVLEACPDAAELIDKKGRNFLHVAIERGHESVVRYVVANPLLVKMVNEQDKEGNTPLHSAVMSGNPNLSILDSGVVELNIADNEGRTPFDLASKITTFLFMIATVLKLSAHGARFGKLRKDDITPWKAAETIVDPSQNGENGAESRAIRKETNSTHDARRIAENALNAAAIKDLLDKTSKNFGIVSVLIATVGLSAMFNVPGGYDSNGVANLRATVQYKAFLLLDTVAVSTSVIATMLVTYGRAARFSAAWLFLALIFIWVALMSIVLAFMAAVVSGLDSTITKRIIWGIFVMPFALVVGFSAVWPVPAPIFTSLCLLVRALAAKDWGRMRRHVGRRFPLVRSYLLALYLFWFLNAVALGITFYIIRNTM